MTDDLKRQSCLNTSTDFCQLKTLPDIGMITKKGVEKSLNTFMTETPASFQLINEYIYTIIEN